MPPTDTVAVATSGSIDRDDKCSACGQGMIFRVCNAACCSGRVTAKFCGNLQDGCPKALVEIPE